MMSIHPFSITVFFPALRVAGVLEPVPAVLRRRQDYTLEKFPLHCRATLKQTTIRICSHNYDQFRDAALPKIMYFCKHHCCITTDKAGIDEVRC